ncbi:MAG: CaiB/BaiF CoA transferase family protein [Hyphomicrobiaceae bacterium]
MAGSARGPICGLRVVEFAGIGPGPFCCMLLADMGAEIIRIDRTDRVNADPLEPRFNPLLRNRQNIAVDLKLPAGRDVALKLCDSADILIEGFRPGVMERLGLGPDIVTARNRKLVYGRMTGWGQDGPIAHMAGHDINYIAISGALHAIGTRDSGPVPPLNLVGDFGGGALYLAMGVLAAYIAAQRSGEGQVVDAAMVEGAASLMSAAYGALAEGSWKEVRQNNRLDGGAHFYGTYETLDGGHMGIGPIEPQFYAIFLDKLGIDANSLPEQMDRSQWPAMRERLAAVFRTKTREQWTEIFDQTDACVLPVLSMSEAATHPHNAARGSFVEVEGVVQPAPVPKFSTTPRGQPTRSAHAGDHTNSILARHGFSEDELRQLAANGVIKQR